MEQVSLFVAFGAGLLSFLSPCVLPLVPVYLGSLAGPEILEATSRQRRWPLFLRSLSFVIGFSIVFVLLGAVAGLAGLALNRLVAIRQISGGLMVAFGLFLIVASKVPWLNYEKRLNLLLGATTGRWRPFLTGAIFCLAWTPCVSPVLGGILTLALTSATVWSGASLLAIYSLGLGLPFLAMGIAFDVVAPFLKSFSRYSRWIYLISGILLVTIGILILTNKLVWFQTTFSTVSLF